MSKGKISLQRPPAVEHLWFLPDISEYKTFTQFPCSEEQIYKQLNSEVGSLSNSSVRNMLSSQGIRRSDFKSKFLKPVFKALGSDGRKFFRQQRKSVFKKFPVQVRNSAEWLAAVDHFPDDNLFKRFICTRTDIFLYEREQSMHDRTFVDTREQWEYLLEFYSQHANIDPLKLEVIKSEEWLELVEKKIPEESLSELTTQELFRFMVAAQTDFYLGLVSTLPQASVFRKEIFPRFIADTQSDSQASMVRAVLD